MKSLISILALLLLVLGTGDSTAATPEEIWKSLEKLAPAEREKKLVEGAKKEGEMLWYTNSGIENATRYIQALRKTIPLSTPSLARQDAPSDPAGAPRSSSRQKYRRRHQTVHRSAAADARQNLLGKYETPGRAIYPAHAKSSYYTSINYAFRVFAFNPRKVTRKDVPTTWEELLQPRWKGEILFDESSLEEVMALMDVWGKEKTINYLTKLSQQDLLIRVARHDHPNDDGRGSPHRGYDLCLQ